MTPTAMFALRGLMLDPDGRTLLGALTPIERHVLLALANWTRDECPHVVYPSLTTVAKATGYARSTVVVAIDGLVAKRWVQRSGTERLAPRAQPTTRYTLLIPAVVRHADQSALQTSPGAGPQVVRDTDHYQSASRTSGSPGAGLYSRETRSTSESKQRSGDQSDTRTSIETAESRALHSALGAHPSLREAATVDFAGALDGWRMSQGAPVDAYVRAIAEVAVDVAGQGLNAVELQKRIRGYCSRAKLARSAQSSTGGGQVVRLFDRSRTNAIDPTIEIPEGV